jgi:predicted Fe-Mo cluster-binding NifX family protein
MKIAMPVWENQVSTVLDFSETLLIIDIDGGEVKGQTGVDWSLCNDPMKLALIKEAGVSTMLCGAVSRPLQTMLKNSGIILISCLRGRTDAILKAYLDGNLHGDGFRLPGSSMKELLSRKGRCRNKRSSLKDTNEPV